MKSEEGYLDIQQNFARNMRFYRKRLGYTLSDVALLAEMDRTHLNLIELGKRNTTLESAGKIAEALQTTIVDMIE